MEKEIFKSERSFVFLDYTFSHGQLLLRSDKRKGTNNKNIDIIFYDTTYLQLFTVLNKPIIKQISKEGFTKYNSVTKYLTHNENNLFEIECSGEKYYIAASFIRVFENELDFLVTSLGDENMAGNNEIARSFDW